MEKKMKLSATVALTIAISSFSANSMATVIDFSGLANGQGSSDYTADGVTATISNPTNYSGGLTTFASDYDGLGFRLTDDWFYAAGHTDIDTFDISFTKDVTIDQFVIDYAESNGSVGFSISGSNGTSAFLDISNPGTYSFNSGSIPQFLASQNYTFNFTATGDRLSQIAQLHFTEVSNVPVPAAVWLFASGLIGFLGMRKRPAQVTPAL